MDEKRLKIFLREYGILFVLIIEVILFSLVSPNFLNTQNIFNVIRQCSMLGIVCVGMTFVMISGGIDLTVGSNVGLSVVVCAMAMVNANLHPVIAVLLAIGSTAFIGAVNAFVIAKVGVAPLIVTLGMYTTVRGLVYLLTNALPIFGFTESFRVIGQGVIGPVPVPVIILAAAITVGYILLNKTSFGRYVYAIGGNKEASAMSGVKVPEVLAKTYILSGIFSGIAGVVLLSRINSGQPRAGIGYEFDAVTAVVLGGVSVSGGEGKLSGTMIGVLIMGVLSNGFVLLNLSEYWQMFIKGLVLLVAVTFDLYSTMNRQRMDAKAMRELLDQKVRLRAKE